MITSNWRMAEVRSAGRAPLQGNFRVLERERGAVAVIFAVTLLVVIGMIGLAIDISRVYNRRVELQGIARVAALAAARQLDGTKAGVEAAETAASEAVATSSYAYGNSAVTWSSSALRFSTTAPPNATWTDAVSAAAAPQKVFYTKVDLSELGSTLGTIKTILIHVLSAKLSSVTVNEVAVAGRTAINVTPLAVCALSPVRAAPRKHLATPEKIELIEFGFRRGVSYDLMQLNSHGTSPQTFVVDPLSPPGTTGTVANTSDSVVGPFVCAGQMWMPHLNGGKITVAKPFPLSTLHVHLNSRFNQYGSGSGACSPGGAPPDYNVKPYYYNSGATWMGNAMSGQSAESYNHTDPETKQEMRVTIADPDPALSSNTAGKFGPLWGYAKAVPYSQYKMGEAEPAKGYSTFSTSDWSVLYKTGTVASSTYPAPITADSPYHTSAGSVHFLAPTGTNRLISKRQRRVIYVPLLDCSSTPSEFGIATVHGVGKFFLTVPATSTTIYAEFAGAVDVPPGASVELL